MAADAIGGFIGFGAGGPAGAVALGAAGSGAGFLFLEAEDGNHGKINFKTKAFVMYTSFNRFLYCSVLLLAFFHGSTQQIKNPGIKIVADFGAIKPAGLNDSISNNLSTFSSLGIEKSFTIRRGFYYTTGLGVYQQNYFVDGYFSKQGEVIVFKGVEKDVINNKLEIFGLKIPVLLSYELFSKNDKAVVFNAGADINIFIRGTRKYKQNNGIKTSESFFVDNKMQIPLRFEVSTLNYTKQKPLNSFIYGFGVRQQVTNYLKSASFKPFEAYFRLGYQF